MDTSIIEWIIFGFIIWNVVGVIIVSVMESDLRGIEYRYHMTRVKTFQGIVLPSYGIIMVIGWLWKVTFVKKEHR